MSDEQLERIAAALWAAGCREDHDVRLGYANSVMLSLNAQHTQTRLNVLEYIHAWEEAIYDSIGDQAKTDRAIELAEVRGLFDPCYVGVAHNTTKSEP